MHDRMRSCFIRSGKTSDGDDDWCCLASEDACQAIPPSETSSSVSEYLLSELLIQRKEWSEIQFSVTVSSAIELVSRSSSIGREVEWISDDHLLSSLRHDGTSGHGIEDRDVRLRRVNNVTGRDNLAVLGDLAALDLAA